MTAIRLILTVIFGLSCFLYTSAQQQLSGAVFDAQTDSTLQDVFLVNLNTNQTTTVSKTGRYSIPAAEGHRIVFSAIGYVPDTLKVEFHMFVTGYDISLRQRYNLLKTVIVTERDYSTDSLERREAYRHILDEPLPGITGRNTPQSGFGIVLSPASFFSSKNRQERELKKKLLDNERIEYVDYRFSRSFVQRYTGLKGDSLQTFMLRFRPTYEFCRQSNEEDMINYINARLKIYLRRKKHKRMKESVNKAARLVWDYHHMNHSLEKSDCIFALGSHDLRVAEWAAQLWLEGWAPLLLLSGGLGNFTQGMWTEKEADKFAAIARKMGVPEDVILIENQSTNTGENILFSKALLAANGLDPNSFIVVQKPYMEKRSYATFKKHMLEKELLVTSPPLSYDEYPNEEIPLERIINIMVGDLQRIKEYPAKGFQIEMEIPGEVWDAFELLVREGYGQHLIREERKME